MKNRREMRGGEGRGEEDRRGKNEDKKRVIEEKGREVKGGEEKR